MAPRAMRQLRRDDLTAQEIVDSNIIVFEKKWTIPNPFPLPPPPPPPPLPLPAPWIRKPAPDSVAGLRVREELDRCLQVLVKLFPDCEFRKTSPSVNLVQYSPLSEVPFQSAWHQVMVDTQTDLTRPGLDVLTLLLHRAVHLANGFRWIEDCNWRSRHNRRFQALAEEVGLEVSWVDSRYAWAGTRPTPELREVLEGLDFAEQLLAPFQDPPRTIGRSMNWHCGQSCLPEPEEIRTVLGLPLPERHRMRLHAVHGRVVRRDDQSPMLKITGKWLAQYGFPQGTRVRVDARYGDLRIRTRNWEAELEQEDY